MPDSVDWRDAKYAEVFEQELRGLARRRASGTGCTVEDLEGTLKHLYVMNGADWAGRGDVQDVIMSAVIAAHEHFLAELKSAAGKT